MLSYWALGCYGDMPSFGIKTHHFFKSGNNKEPLHQMLKYTEHMRNAELLESQPQPELSFSMAGGHTQGFLLDLFHKCLLRDTPNTIFRVSLFFLLSGIYSVIKNNT